MAEDGAAPLRRKQDRSNEEVRRVLAQSIEQIGRWRGEMVVLMARTARPLSSAARDSVATDCARIEAGIVEIRTMLLLDLADAPPKVKGSSRVTDVETALDSIERGLAELRGRLR